MAKKRGSRVLRIGDAPGGNYEKNLQDFAKDIKDPNVYHVNICHDDWCNIFKGGKCNCNPDVKTSI